MQTIQKRQLLILAAIPLLCLTACKKAHTISEFLHDPALMKTTRAYCIANPAERAEQGDCVNVGHAGSMIAANDHLVRCYKPGTVDHACVDAALAEYKNL